MTRQILAVLLLALGAHIEAQQLTGGRPVLSEVFPIPESSDRYEYAEIYNPTTSTLSLDGYKLCDGSRTACSNLAGNLPLNGYYVVCRDISQYAPCNIASGLFLETLSSLVLVNPGGLVIDAAFWSTVDIPLGSSFVRGTVASDLLRFVWDSSSSPGVGLLGGLGPTSAPVAPLRDEGFVFLNEISAADGFVEIAYDIVQSIADFKIAVYTPSGIVDEIFLSEATPASVLNGLSFATLPFSPPAGSVFGLALVADDGDVLQFVSVGTPLKPTSGPAAGLGSDFLGDVSTAYFAASGSGCDPSAFSFTVVGTPTPGSVNPNQNPGCGEIIGFINEIQQGGASSNFIEIAYTSGAAPSALTLEFYSTAGSPTQTLSLTDAIGGTVSDGLKFDYFPLEDVSGGFALSRTDTDPPEVLHFISVGPAFIAVSGLATGLTATSIGVTPAITGITSVGFIGSGCALSDFFFVFPASTPGSINSGQAVSCATVATNEFLTGSPSLSPTDAPSQPPSSSPTLVASHTPTETNACDPNPCHPLATCTSIGTNFQCACLPGYEGNGLTTGCRDVDECSATPYPCSQFAFCVDSEGSFACSCFSGFTGDGFVCDDVNECQTLQPCSSLARCENKPGGFDCFCNQGYVGNGVTCLDLDECLTSATNNCSPNAICTNTDGSFSCACRDGFLGDGITCTKITPPPSPSPTPAPTNADPTPRPTRTSEPPSNAPSRSNPPSFSSEPSDNSPSALPSFSLGPSETFLPTRSPSNVPTEKPSVNPSSFPSITPSDSELPSITKFPSSVPSRSSFPSITTFPTQGPSRSNVPSTTSFPSRSPSK